MTSRVKRVIAGAPISAACDTGAMPLDLLVRRARLGEAEIVCAVWLAARRAAFPAIPAPVHSEDEIRRWFVEEVFPMQEVWVAEVERAVVGMLVVEAGCVAQLSVDPSYQRGGVGGMLLERAKLGSPEGLHSWTFESHRFYERHGFVLVESTDGRENEERSPDRRYRWPAPGRT